MLPGLYANQCLVLKLRVAEQAMAIHEVRLMSEVKLSGDSTPLLARISVQKNFVSIMSFAGRIFC